MTTQTMSGFMPVILRVGQIPARGQNFSALLTQRGVVWIFLAVAAILSVNAAYAAPGTPSIFDALVKWTPLIARGFLFNIVISVCAMALGTILGIFIGIGQLSLHWPLRATSWSLTHFFRNAPWLVILFYCMLLLPFKINVGGVIIPMPDWIKAIIGFSIAIAANMSELVRGAILSIPTGQWESAESLGYPRTQIMWRIILPQCVKRILPPWMNLYALTMVSTPLCSIVGVSEVMTLTSDALAADGRHALLLPMYGYLLLWFFVYCYPIARWTVALERRYEVHA